jgi:hypothetical protein
VAENVLRQPRKVSRRPQALNMENYSADLSTPTNPAGTFFRELAETIENQDQVPEI